MSHIFSTQHWSGSVDVFDSELKKSPLRTSIVSSLAANPSRVNLDNAIDTILRSGKINEISRDYAADWELKKKEKESTDLQGNQRSGLARRILPIIVFGPKYMGLLFVVSHFWILLVHSRQQALDAEVDLVLVDWQEAPRKQSSWHGQKLSAVQRENIESIESESILNKVNKAIFRFVPLVVWTRGTQHYTTTRHSEPKPTALCKSLEQSKDHRNFDLKDQVRPTVQSSHGEISMRQERTSGQIWYPRSPSLCRNAWRARWDDSFECTPFAAFSYGPRLRPCQALPKLAHATLQCLPSGQQKWSLVRSGANLAALACVARWRRCRCAEASQSKIVCRWL